ncbi:MAG: multifunctional CCA tRNA nucleotidyl transferase/2'3'-cyclic phosphodiesterase/2'nucleotidase/phosphatase [Burkholderiales bacterium RIFCSPHIGHO2_12_FULL_61_11]|nr:MAG: multifunctional CCA tRNA nucleotidyl transferase/2'3'-cyclic phosphodiesterase/2'nucleotidase/phosphatase [Burkholderiales bacterium RIFCSPHIGHO2_12_FULL_61_11]
MQIYMVGGAVRDALLGLEVADHDWVVVGGTPEELVAQGFIPVGRDFPVFLHPQSHEEYALARTERKSAPGYRGFVVHAEPDVTLEQDLARRDLTINSMAAPARSVRAHGAIEPDLSALIDPYGGQQDLQRKVLRHVTGAFREDPVRILRLARFAARFADFSVAPETRALMQHMVASGEVDALVPERVWQELARGLMEAKPSRMFEVLRDCGALQKLLPEVARLWGVPQRAEYHPEIDTGLHLMLVLDMAAQLQAPLPVRFACLGHDLGKGSSKLGADPNFVAAQDIDNTPEIWRMKMESDPGLGKHIGHEERSARLLKGLCQRLRVPTDCRELADVVAREHGNIHRSSEFSAAAVVRLLERCDAFRKPQRFADILLACECDARGRHGFENAAYPQRQRLLQALTAAQSVATDQVAADAQAAGQSGQQIGQWIHQARVAAVSRWPGFAAE